MCNFRISEIFSNTKRIIIAVESVAINHGNSGAGCWLYGQIEAVAIVVFDQGSTYAFDVNAKPVSVKLLRKEIPALDTKISELHTHNGLPEEHK